MSKPAKKSHRKLFTVGSDAPFQFTEAYKSLRTNLEFLSASGNCKTILITSSVPEEGKTNVAVNLAITLASSGKRVVLVDCDMRKSAVSRYLRIPRSRTGLTNVITSHEENALASALIRMKDTGITVLPVGTIPPNPAELLASSTTEKIFKALQNAFDYVIVDTIQCSLVSKKNLEAVNAHILGVIMNGYNAKKTGRRDGYSYAYSYGYYDSKQETDE